MLKMIVTVTVSNHQSIEVYPDIWVNLAMSVQLLEAALVEVVITFSVGANYSSMLFY
jgi:hypothetical protein